MKNKFSKNKGAVTTLVLVFSGVFLILLAGLISFIVTQMKYSKRQTAWNEAVHVAEAGINYYLWCLNNEKGDLCQTEKDYLNPAGNPIGRFSLEITPKMSCGKVTERTIIATGWLYDYPQVKRKIKVFYGKTSVAKYAYLLNDNVWAGEDREIKGLYHSNGGIRMDGENSSLVTSASQTWVCTDSFGCSPCPTSMGCQVQSSQCVCPGVFGAGENQDLWEWPAPQFDFVGMTIDLAEMKNLAQQPGGGGVYLPPSTNINPNGKGYHVKFLNNGNFEVRIITALQSTQGYSLEEGWHYDYFIITGEYLYNTYSISSNCSLIFLEDNLWVEGQVKGKATIASANLIDPNKDTSVVLPGNIDYTVLDGSDGLAVIGEKNVLISPASPDIMELRGIFIAQKGHFGRNHYTNNLREKLELTGSIISNGREGTKWTSGGQIVSGYMKRENYFDSNLVYSPPPFIPYLSEEYQVLKWNEI